MDGVGCAISARPGLFAEPQKIIFDLQLADLAVEFADLGFVGLVVPLAAVLEHAPSSSAFFQAWIWLGPYSLASSPTALDRRQGNLRLESCAVFLSRLLH